MNRAGAQAMLLQTGRWPAPWFRNTTSVAVRSRRLRSIDDRFAVAGDRAALGPGDQVGAAVGAGRRIHHAQHRRALAQQGDRNGAAAAPFQEGAGAVMRIDHPAIAVRLGRQHTFFLADESGRQQRGQALTEKKFDLGIDWGGVGVAEAWARRGGRTRRRARLRPVAQGRSRPEEWGAGLLSVMGPMESRRSRRDTLSPLHHPPWIIPRPRCSRPAPCRLTRP